MLNIVNCKVDDFYLLLRMWGDVRLGCGWPKSNEGGGIRQRGHQCFFILFSQNNSFLAILKSQPLLQVLHFFHHIFKKRLALSVPLIFSHLSNLHSLGDFKRNNMSMFTQTTTERVDQLGPLSQTHKHKTHKTHKIQAHCAVTHRDLVEPRNWNKEFACDRLDGRGHTGGAVQPEDLRTK